MLRSVLGPVTGSPRQRDRCNRTRSIVPALGTIVRVLVALGALLTLSAPPASAGESAATSAENVASTHAFLLARYKLDGALLQDAAAAHTAESAAAAQIARECHGVLSRMPWPSLDPAPTPRARGENARLAHQQETIETELAAATARPRDSVYRSAVEAYAAEVRQLSWGDPTIASLVQVAITTDLEDVSTPAPTLCADARAWAQSGFRALSAASREFEASRAARRSSARGEKGSPDTLLEPSRTHRIER
jgi:hypothetical protein